MMSPPPGISVEPLGDVLIKLLPEGFAALLAPAAALPALSPMLAPADPVATPQDEDPHPASNPRLPEPSWANAIVLASANTVANPIAATFMTVFLSYCRHWKSGEAARRSHGSHYDFDSLAHLSGYQTAPDSIRSAGVLRALHDGLRLWRVQAARGAPGVGSRLVRNIS